MAGECVALAEGRAETKAEICDCFKKQKHINVSVLMGKKNRFYE